MRTWSGRSSGWRRAGSGRSGSPCRSSGHRSCCSSWRSRSGCCCTCRGSGGGRSGWRGSAGAGQGEAVGGRAPADRRPWTRRIPAVLTVLGVTILVFSLARPQSVIGVPRLEGTVILAFDVSGSMAATDVAPTRMEAAKTAALAFIEGQPTLRAHRDRGLQRHGLLDADPDRRPRRARGRDRAPRAGARHVPGPRHPGGPPGHREGPRPVEDRLLPERLRPAAAGTDPGPGRASTSRR